MNPKQKKATAIKMYRDGYKTRAICDSTGYTECSFYAMLRREGVPSRKAQGHPPEAIYLAKWLDIPEDEAARLYAIKQGPHINPQTLSRAKIKLKHVAELPLPEGYGVLFFPLPVIVTPDDQIPLTWLDILCLFRNPLKWIQENIK